MKLSEKIKLLRTTHDMTQPELANKAGIEQSYLSKLENDKGSPSFDVINKLARVYDMSGIELINSLSQSYIEKHLTHIPEVAAEIASMKRHLIIKLKQRFIWSSLVVVIGVGLIYLGVQSVIFATQDRVYISHGVIKEGETPYQFQDSVIKEIGESQSEYEARLKSNRSRIKVEKLVTTENKGRSFIVEHKNERRLYDIKESRLLNSNKNEWVTALGVMLVVAGIFMFWYSFKFKSD